MALYLSTDYQTSFESFSLPARKKFKMAILDFQSEPQNRISTWLLGRPWISDQNNLAIFIYKSPRYFLSSFESISLFVQAFKLDFQDGDCGGHI